jgi:type IV pilus assembly protein PilY1
MVGLGVSGTLNFSTNTDCTDASAAGSDACNLRKGVSNSSGKVGWTSPNGSGSGIAENIDDTWHAGLAGRGQFFSAANPQNLVDQLSDVLSNISARAAQPTTSAINASVLTTGALAFNTGYSSIDWSGVMQAFPLNADGTVSSAYLWDANDTLTNKTASTDRKILTASKSGTTISGMAFESSSSFDLVEQAGINFPLSTDLINDTQANRINYLRGVRDNEKNGAMRARSTLLGAIINSQGVYLSYPASGYTNNWPAGSPEALAAAAASPTDVTDDKSYDHFTQHYLTRAPMFYVGANDGMLHAFNAPVPVCTGNDPVTGACTGYGGAGTGIEQFAYVPRAAYGNLGNLTSASSFKYAPTVDGTPVTRDVFFSQNSANEWHTILVGGLRLGGRGIYALDVTDPTKVDETTAGVKKVLWEFDSDSAVTAGCKVFGTAAQGNTACDPSHLGYTFGQPNVGRLASGQWVVIVPSGYFPDCSQTDRPVICNGVYPTQPKDTSGVPYSSMFVLDAQTGAMLAELKTPTTTSIPSYGLTSPVLGDYNNDQIEDVGYAGDLSGNLWRFDFSGTSASAWKVTLAYQAATQGYQPITVMPRLFPDPSTNRFIVVFGTGKYLGSGDNTSASAQVQAMYGIRDKVDSSGNPITVQQTDLAQRYLYETTVTDPADPNYGATLRGLCLNSSPSVSSCTPVSSLDASYGGWRIDLNAIPSSGERVVVTAAAIFASNTAIISTLIPGSSDPCNPNVLGAIMALNAAIGGAGQGVSSLGGLPYIGARVNNVRTSGSLPVATKVGGGSLIIPGLTLTGKKNNAATPLTLDAPIWRRRSWLELNNGQ